MYAVMIQTDVGLDELADALRTTLNIPSTNHTVPFEQARHGVSHGGSYYHFESCGLELVLVCNHGETLLPQYPGCPFYVYLHQQQGDDQDQLSAVAEHLAAFLRDSGFHAIAAITHEVA